MGKKKEGVQNERPLLIVLASVNEKREVVRAASGLVYVRGYESVFVRSDVTKERRQELRVSRASGSGTLDTPTLRPSEGSQLGLSGAAEFPIFRSGDKALA